MEEIDNKIEVNLNNLKEISRLFLLAYSSIKTKISVSFLAFFRLDACGPSSVTVKSAKLSADSRTHSLTYQHLCARVVFFLTVLTMVYQTLKSFTTTGIKHFTTVKKSNVEIKDKCKYTAPWAESKKVEH